MEHDTTNVSTAQGKRNASPDRMLTFSDGVFAIIITILVLDLEAPDLSSGQSLSKALLDLRPALSTFVISFLLIGMYWVWHRSMFDQVRYVNNDVVWLNLLYLLPISLIPFAASVLGSYSTDATALHVYGAVLVAVTLLRVGLDVYFRSHPDLMWEPANIQARRLGTMLAGAPLVVYVIAMLVASSWPTLSLILYFSVPLLYFGLITILRRSPRTEAAVDTAT